MRELLRLHVDFIKAHFAAATGTCAELANRSVGYLDDAGYPDLAKELSDRLAARRVRQRRADKVTRKQAKELHRKSTMEPRKAFLILDADEVRQVLKGDAVGLCRPFWYQPEAHNGDKSYVWSGLEVNGKWFSILAAKPHSGSYTVVSPWGEAGATLWCKEIWCRLKMTELETDEYIVKTFYAATGEQPTLNDSDGDPVLKKDGTEAPPWKSAAVMPRERSRITVKLLKVEPFRDACGIWCWSLTVQRVVNP